MNLFQLVLTFKHKEIPNEKGHLLYSKSLNTMLLILYDNKEVVQDCKSLALKAFSSNPTTEDIEEIGYEFIKQRHGEEVLIDASLEWKTYKATTG